MTQAKQRDYRYERKFLVEGMDGDQIRMLVKRHPGMFYEPYPPRYVNNLYLDTEQLDNYQANLSGMADRHKVRIRWYGDPLEQVNGPLLEFKVKRGLVGTKYSYSFPEFQIDDGFDYRAFQKIIQASDLPARVRHELRGLQVVLCNRYFRWYFSTKDQRYRITIDTDLSYFRVKKFSNNFKGRFLDQKHVVVELKYDRALDPIVDKVSGFFPFITTRNSKYITGIESVFL